MKLKVLIASGSRHTIPPVQNSPGVPRIIYQLTETNHRDFDFHVISKYSKLLRETAYDKSKYFHPKPDLLSLLEEFFLQFLPYRWRKNKYGFTQPDRIVYYENLVKEAKEIEPEIVITFMHFELFKMLRKALPKSKHVFFFRSTDLLGRLGKENVDFLIRNSAGFLANTKLSVKELKEINSEITFPVDTIYNAVDEVFITKDERTKIGTRFRQKFGLDDKDFIIGYAGRFSSEKSLKELFETVKDLKQEGVIIHIIIAGDILNEKTPNHDYFNELIAFKDGNLLNQVHFAGWITNSDLYNFYCALDVGVLLSKYREGNSMFLIEAMSYGVPVIATAVGGNTEIISSGINGFLINIDSLKADLKANINFLKNDSAKYETCSNNARNYISENHSKEIMVKLFNDFIVRL